MRGCRVGLRRAASMPPRQIGFNNPTRPTTLAAWLANRRLPRTLPDPAAPRARGPQTAIARDGTRRGEQRRLRRRSEVLHGLGRAPGVLLVVRQGPRREGASRRVASASRARRSDGSDRSSIAFPPSPPPRRASTLRSIDRSIGGEKVHRPTVHRRSPRSIVARSPRRRALTSPSLPRPPRHHPPRSRGITTGASPRATGSYRSPRPRTRSTRSTTFVPR